MPLMDLFIRYLLSLEDLSINIGDISETLANIGDFTPNGATMTAILSIQKGQELSVIWPFMAVLYGYVSLCVLLAIVLFPRRGVTGMTGIWIARLQNLKRKPVVLIMMTLMTLVMAYVLGSSSNGTTNIYVALDESGKTQAVWKELNEVEGYTFHKMTENELLLKVNEDIRIIGVLG